MTELLTSFLDGLRFFEIGIPDFFGIFPTFEVRPELYELRLRAVDSADRADLAVRRPLLMGGKGELRPVGGAELELPPFR